MNSENTLSNSQNLPHPVSPNQPAKVKNSQVGKDPNEEVRRLTAQNHRLREELKKINEIIGQRLEREQFKKRSIKQAPQEKDLRDETLKSELLNAQKVINIQKKEIQQLSRNQHEDIRDKYAQFESQVKTLNDQVSQLSQENKALKNIRQNKAQTIRIQQEKQIKEQIEEGSMRSRMNALLEENKALRERINQQAKKERSFSVPRQQNNDSEMPPINKGASNPKSNQLKEKEDRIIILEERIFELEKHLQSYGNIKKHYEKQVQNLQFRIRSLEDENKALCQQLDDRTNMERKKGRMPVRTSQSIPNRQAGESVKGQTTGTNRNIQSAKEDPYEQSNNETPSKAQAQSANSTKTVDPEKNKGQQIQEQADKVQNQKQNQPPAKVENQKPSQQPQEDQSQRQIRNDPPAKVDANNPKILDGSKDKEQQQKEPTVKVEPTNPGKQTNNAKTTSSDSQQVKGGPPAQGETITEPKQVGVDKPKDVQDKTGAKVEPLQSKQPSTDRNKEQQIKSEEPSKLDNTQSSKKGTQDNQKDLQVKAETPVKGERERVSSTKHGNSNKQNDQQFKAETPKQGERGKDQTLVKQGNSESMEQNQREGEELDDPQEHDSQPMVLRQVRIGLVNDVSDYRFQDELGKVVKFHNLKVWTDKEDQIKAIQALYLGDTEGHEGIIEGRIHTMENLKGLTQQFVAIEKKDFIKRVYCHKNEFGVLDHIRLISAQNREINLGVLQEDELFDFKLSKTEVPGIMFGSFSSDQDVQNCLICLGFNVMRDIQRKMASNQKIQD